MKTTASETVRNGNKTFGDWVRMLTGETGIVIDVFVGSSGFRNLTVLLDGKDMNAAGSAVSAMEEETAFA